MFNPFEIYRKLKNSKTWNEFFASCFVDLDKLNKELEGQTETQQIKILKDALGKQNSKVKELVEMIAKQNEQIEELTNENQKIKDGRIKELEESTKNNELTDLLIEANKEADKLEKSIKETTTSFQNLIEIRK